MRGRLARDERTSHEELAGRAQAGCTESFDELMLRLQVPLLHFLRQQVAAADAEDLVQDTFVRAYRNLHRYRPRWRFQTWLFTIARRLAINHLRRPRLAAGCGGLDRLPHAEPGPVQAAMANERRQQLWQVAATSLSEAAQTALWLHYVEQMPVREIARVLHRSPIAVKAIMFRARQTLLPFLQKLDLDGATTRRPCTPQAEAVTHG